MRDREYVGDDSAEAPSPRQASTPRRFRRFAGKHLRRRIKAGFDLVTGLDRSAGHAVLTVSRRTPRTPRFGAPGDRSPVSTVCKLGDKRAGWA